MALYDQSIEKLKISQEFHHNEDEIIGSLCRLGYQPLSPKTQMEQEKKIRREIANSNERRRMQSINAGFQSLKTLLPHNEGEKLSKAAILQQTADYIYQLEQEKTKLLSQNCQLKRLVNNQFGHDSDGGSSADSPLPKRKRMEAAESSDEGIGNMSPYEGDSGNDDLKREMIDLRIQLDRERRMRLKSEEQFRNLEARLYPDRSITDELNMQYEESKLVSDEASHEDTNIHVVSSGPGMLPQIIDSSSSCPDSDEPQDLSTSPDEKRSRPCTSPSALTCPVPSSSSIISHTQRPSSMLTVSSPSSTMTAAPTIAVPLQSERQSDSPTLKAMLTQSEIDISSQRLYPASTSRQNLETIVEAIRHLEGDHLFQDDPLPKSPKTIAEHSSNSFSDEITAFRHPIIQCSQSRPGVIVATHS